ncbi:MAG TPA: prolipoprotein diacylglyceryl transferase family protein, partial [Anaerolineales bacterium]
MNLLSIFQNFFAPPRDLILVILAAWIGLSLSERRAPRHHVNLDALSNLLLIGTAGFVIGGRVLYAIENLSTFGQSPASIFSLNIALFDLWGGLTMAIIAAFAYGKRTNLPLWRSLDALTPFFAALAI